MLSVWLISWVTNTGEWQSRLCLCSLSPSWIVEAALTFQEGNTSWGGVPDENYYWELRNSDFRLNLECTVSQGPTRQQQIFWRRPLVTGQGYSTIVQPHRCLQWPCFLGVTTFLYLCWHLIAKKNVVWSQNTKKLWAVIGKNSLIIANYIISKP